jgi:hypothetical protein
VLSFIGRILCYEDSRQSVSSRVRSVTSQVNER